MPGAITRRAFVGAAVAAPAVARLLGVQGDRNVVVVGAGAFGGWSALALQRAGFRVTLVDAWGPGNARASSGGETRVIRAVYGGVPLYSTMAARALTLWREAEARWGRRMFHRTGALWLCEGDDAYVRTSIEPMRANGLAVETLTPDAASRRFPQMSFRDARIVYYEPEAGFITARAACEIVRDAFVREGGTYRQARVRPDSLGRAGGRLASVTLSDGTTLSAERFVFACGPWLPELFPGVIGRRIVATRQEVFFFGVPAADQRFDAAQLPVWVHLGERLTYGLPSVDGRGVKVADDTSGEEVDPTTLDRVPSADGTARARQILRQRFPGLGGAPLLEARVCQYEASTDGHFLVDRHPGHDNVWLVGGGSGHGFKMGPALAEHVASMVQGQSSANPLFAYGRLKERAHR